jgi:hypothetical protein
MQQGSTVPQCIYDNCRKLRTSPILLRSAVRVILIVKIVIMREREKRWQAVLKAKINIWT